MVRIVHLSDFHLNQRTLKDFDEFILKALIKDLQKYHKEKPIDLIAFSGDLIDKGGESFENDIDLAFLNFTFKIIDPIINALNIPKDRFLFVPGNHDIKRSLDSKYSETGLKSSLTNTELVNEYIDNDSKEGRNRIIPFKRFERDFYSNFQGEHEITDFQSNYTFNIRDKKIVVTCFNSVWRCYDNDDKNKIILGERQITNSREFLENTDLKIGIVHHHFEWFAKFEKKNIEGMLIRDYELLFSGHIHEGDSNSNNTMHGNLFCSISPANWSDNIRGELRTYANGYSIVDYDFKCRTITVLNRRYSYKKECFDPNTDLGDSNGVIIYKLPDTELLIKKKYEQDIAEKIKGIYFQDMNKHLLSYNTDTSAPKNIDEMFVLPRIIEKKEYDTDNDNQGKNFDLTDLCTINNHHIIFGSKESGKTILLDKVLMEITNNIKRYEKIPVYIEFNDISNSSRIETLVSRYLGIGILDIKGKLKEHIIILLIDDISFSENDKYTIKKLETFLQNYENVKVLGTSLENFEGEVPLNAYEYKFMMLFKPLHIQSFRTKEIKLLTKKWFSDNENYDPDKLNKLVKAFTTLNIPRTPLAVSMFLWIIEQQENYKPINNATMLENFIERLFKKQARKEIYSERFDYRNKERLLAEIAYKMYKSNNTNYRLTLNEIRNFVYEYLKVLKFDFQEDVVLKEFIDNGILVTENEESDVHIRFRFTCFLKYFLMKYMKIDESFKVHVLNEENYLFFEDEIDYYTGVNRDESVILELLVNRMNEKFKDLIDNINTLPNSFDSIFETRSTIASQLDENEMKKILAKNKPSEEELEKLNDSMLENVKVEKGINKRETELSQFDQLYKSWTLAAKVLKNTEETKKINLKSNSFRHILKCSMAFACLYKILIQKYLEGKEGQEGTKENLRLLNKFMPLIHQIVTYTHMGTRKLNLVIKEFIEVNIDKSDVTDFEKFIAVFMYADLKEIDYPEYITRLFKNTRSTYISDMILFKVVTYYFVRSTTKQTDNFYENLIGDIITKSKGKDKSKKTKIIEQYRTKRFSRHDEEEEIPRDA